jgi:antitoxin (DNA-binding transcriptional repressor) of toxin-antitoxin stability system
MFADCVNRVRYQGVSFLLQKNGVPVARIFTVDPASCMNLEDVVAADVEVRSAARADREDTVAPPSDASVDAPALPSEGRLKTPILNW